MNKEGKVSVSIIIATYNAEAHLHACLSTIAQQTCAGIEVVIVDGGSTDGTAEIVKQFSQLNINWCSGKDKGIYDALNKGVKRAKGKWVYFLGADDRLLPGFSKLVAELKDDSTVYYGDSLAWYSNGEPENPYKLPTGRFSAYRLAKLCMNHQSIIYPAKAFDNYEYNLKYRIYADYAFNLRLWGDARFPKLYFPITVVLYNMDGFSSIEGYVDESFEKDKDKLIYEGMGKTVFLRYLIRKFKDYIRS